VSNNIARRLGLAQRVISSPTNELSEFTRNVGVEIEVEEVNPAALKRSLGHIWEVVRDGSLRPPERSAELRSPTPGYSGKQLVESIDALATCEALDDAHFGWRAAAHAHIDMRDKTSEDIQYTLVLYALIEPFIFAWDGTGRHESRFCMPWWVCSGDISTAVNITNATNDNDFSSNIGHFSKYTALNLEPLRRFGTIEFRHAQSTRDRGRLLEYINICLDISNASLKHPDTAPIDMVLEFMTKGPELFIPRWFSANSAAALLRPPMDVVPLTQDILDRSISTALTLAELNNKEELSIPVEMNKDILEFLV